MAIMEPPISKPERSWPTGLNAANHPPRMRFSLRALLVAVTMCALGVAAVVRASHVTLGVVSAATLVAFLVALSTAIYWVGPRRAFAVGFLAWGVPYAVLALWAFPAESDETNCKLITSQFLHAFYPHLLHHTGTRTIMAGGWSSPDGSGGINGFIGTPTDVPHIEPSLDDWIPLGHMLWTWAFAICGGFVTQGIWRRRSTANGR